MAAWFWSRGDESAVNVAMRAVRRGEFVPADMQERAEEDEPLPIGHAQTISQPSLVAYMTEQLALTVASRVLEIGTGSGFQTAILAEIAAEVFTVERLPELAFAAQERLSRLGYHNVYFRTGDGTLGWPEAAPFDAIIVTAAAPILPAALIAQLRCGGKLVAPVGAAKEDQMLVLVEKGPDNSWREQELIPVRFVPLVSDNRA